MTSPKAVYSDCFCRLKLTEYYTSDIMATKKQIESVKTRAQKYKQAKNNDMYISKILISSLAWKFLTADAMRAYFAFRLKCKMEKVKSKASRHGNKDYRIENNGEIQFSYREAKEKWGINNFNRVLDQLIEYGFIDIIYGGGGVMGDVSLYAISERWKLYGTDDFNMACRTKRKACYGFTKPKAKRKNQHSY